MVSRPRVLTVGHSFATGRPRSLRGRLPGVFGHGDNCRARSPGVGDRSRKGRRGRSRAGGRGVSVGLLAQGVDTLAVLSLAVWGLAGVKILQIVRINHL